MTGRTLRTLLAVGLVVSAGCSTDIAVSAWMPNFENQTASGSGSAMVDIKKDFGVDTDSTVLALDLSGRQGSQGYRINYWKITGEGSKIIATDLDFADYTYTAGDQTSTTFDLTNIGVMYEPTLYQNPRFGLLFLLGANLITFNMVATDITTPAPPGDGEVHVPPAGNTFESIGFIPVPVIGLGIQGKFTKWMGLTINATYFDTSNLGLGDDIQASYIGADIALTFGKPENYVMGMVGYKYAHAKYTVDTDKGDSTLDGFIGSVIFTF